MNELALRLKTQLTPCELRVLMYVAWGHESPEIAESFGVDKRTIESHRQSINRKLGINGAARAVQIALAADLILPGDGLITRDLTDRECQIVCLIADGWSNKEIATELGIGVRTVETHRERISRKFGAHNTAQITRKALALGIASNQFLPELQPA